MVTLEMKNMASITLTKWDLAVLFGLEYKGAREGEPDDMDTHLFMHNRSEVTVEGYFLSETAAKESMATQLLEKMSNGCLLLNIRE